MVGDLGRPATQAWPTVIVKNILFIDRPTLGVYTHYLYELA
ncbi:hypothetical protein GDI1970 [Gluconacetobacter diazotrophicus PA1 5]|uniref:Uncharacterized protein n=1 Tax=Gluconacetobacter diazotrophicus (strain ATCC 49037 / DSM 5601 / CCUG 37298 / CIP 103539 / LMG 7603 / PAl5) TaxID=272568 RepID=A9HJJ1_GLUDA|nr:hypothetical protein GDI1970 [Gluconacetobacter diazotrophicus PA1 5]